MARVERSRLGMLPSRDENWVQGVVSMTFSFVRLKVSDLPLLHDWVNRSHVAEYWDGPVELAAMFSNFKDHITSDYVFGYLALLGQKPVGYVQTYEASKVGDGWWPDIEPGTWGIDQFLADGATLGAGLGTKMVMAFSEFVFKSHGAQKLITDPSPDNPRAIRCYEKAGFRAIGERETPDGPALVMQRDH